MSPKQNLRATIRTLKQNHRDFASWYGEDSVQARRVAVMIERAENRLKEA